MDRLTERERQCLRLVARGLFSKQIGHELGISKNRVDELIDSARDKLGGIGRRPAAHLLVEHEAPHPPSGSGGGPIGVELAAAQPPDVGRVAISVEPPSSVRESPEPFRGFPPAPVLDASYNVGPRNDDRAARLAEVAKAMVVLTTFCLLLPQLVQLWREFASWIVRVFY